MQRNGSDRKMIEHFDSKAPAQKLTFISDLHLFSSRSNAEQHRDLIASSIDDADLCVWGGDLFDFRWSRLRDENESVDRSLEWLDHWYQQFPTKQFVFLDGNHDAHMAFSENLAAWTSQRDRFRAGLDCIRVGQTLLLHGDVIEGRGCPDRFSRYREGWQAKPVASTTANKLYDAAIASRAHRAAAATAHRRRNTCIRLLRWMHAQPSEATAGVRRIVFGHTHRRIHAYRVEGVEFYNGGAAIQHVPFHPVSLQTSAGKSAT
jgi:UDP-2,3-diacylglucosamine pyrophosphatase LpxH